MVDVNLNIASNNVTAFHRSATVYYLGIDIGSTSSDLVVLDSKLNIIHRDYRRTMGRPLATALGQLEDVSERIIGGEVCAAATGSAGRLVAKLLGIPFVNEVPAQAAAIHHFYPQFGSATIVEMGGQDTKLIFTEIEDGHQRIRDFALNTVCAAGTGSFLDQQAQRLGVSIEEQFGEMALESRNVPRMAGRCSVFAKSDMIHLQQQATPKTDIVAGLCLALARNLKSNLGCGRIFTKPIIFTGGVAANMGVVRALEQVFELDADELFVPTEHFYTGAVGAVLVAKKKGTIKPKQIEKERIEIYLKKQGGLSHAPRLEKLSQPSFAPPESKVYRELLDSTSEPIAAYLGVDVGSISTNVVVIDKEKRVLSKAYLMTAGQPLEAVRQGLEIVGKEVAGKVTIKGAATTGSGRYLTGDFIGADTVINEITAQAAGAAIVNPAVDTIFEIGGQDSKYIALEKGVVVDFEMNHACAAGTGSFLEEQAQRLGISIKDEFAAKAFSAESPIKLGERCTVFMESDLVSYQQQGAGVPELVAGLSYSIVTNYLNRVVGRRRIGDNICFQGGTAFNKAVWAAFEKVTGKPVMVPDHHEVTGAIGAAAIAAEHMQKQVCEKSGSMPESSFRGFENLAAIAYKVESFTCSKCPNDCEVKKVELPGSDPLYYGSRCDRYNIKKNTATKAKAAAFEYRREKLFEYAGISDIEVSKNGDSAKTIGIPMSLINWQLLPLFSRFFKALGMKVVTSGATTKRTIHKGVESVTAQPCFPVKVAYGHIAGLIEKEVDYILIPSVVSMPSAYGNKHNQLCPYVQSIPYQAQAAFVDKLNKSKILTAPLRMGEGYKHIKKGLAQLAMAAGANRELVDKAIETGLEAQRSFDADVQNYGREMLSKLPAGKQLFVIVSRPYNGCDDGLNLELPRKLAELGIEAIPIDMLDLAAAQLTDKSLHDNMYWSYGQKILRAAEIIKRHPNMFAVYLSNFSCGPDSFLQTFFRDIMDKKPSLQLELDEHSADAGVVTRIEAFIESLKHYKPNGDISGEVFKPEHADRTSIGRKLKLFIPYMGDCAYGMAACFKAFGQDAEVMPQADENTLIKGRRYTTGKECLPCAITAGDMLEVLENNNSEKVAFFMPSACGPCRFGMYNCLHRLILRQAGAAGTMVIAPSQDSSFYKEFLKGMNGSGGELLRLMWGAMVGIDLLGKVIRRIRPFAKNRKAAQAAYESALQRLIKAVENRCSISELTEIMRGIAGDLSKVEIDRTLQKPLVGVVGEIYVRNHPFANGDLINRLEELGAATDLASIAEWIYYTNYTRAASAMRRGKLKDLVTNKAQNYFQHRIEKVLAKPLEEKFGPLAEHPAKEVIKLGGRYLDASFEGEAILSIGKIIEYHHQNVSGVINVMPFTCMPSTIVSTQTQRISNDCKMPVLNLSFDGQEDATLTTRLEAFVEQLRERRTVNVEQLVTF